MIDLTPPPALYLPYDGPGITITRPQPQVARICAALGAPRPPSGKIIFGCEVWGAGGCLRIVAAVPDGGDRRAIQDHEDAHCNGWKHS